MKTFFQWAEENKIELPVLNSDDTEDATSENRVRTGYSANYPPAYVASQYPHKYFNPAKATADLDAENMKKEKK